MEEIIKKGPVPAMPESICIRYANRAFNTGEDTEIRDLSESGIRDIVKKVRKGTYPSLYLALNKNGEMEEGCLNLESGGGLIFLQIDDEEKKTAWTCFDPNLLDSDEEAPVEASDGQSVFPLKCTMRDRELAARCVEWYAHTGEPYPGMDWMKLTW